MVESWQPSETGRRAGEQLDRAQLAERFRRRFNWLSRFTDEELRGISDCAIEGGALLQPNLEYIDISHPEQGVVTAKVGERVSAGACYVSRTDVSPETWRKLISAARQG